MRVALPVVCRTWLALAGFFGGGLLVGCSSGVPVWCADGLADGGCTVHVELHCGGGPLCSPGAVPVLDAGACVRDAAADVLDCS